MIVHVYNNLAMTSLKLPTQQKMATSASLHESFCVYRKEINQAGIKLEAAVVSKFEELESRIDTLEREVRRLSVSKPRPPMQPSAPRSARREEKQGTQSRR